MSFFKRKPYRNKKLLESARGQDCKIRSPYCTGDTGTVVACHSNSSRHGKGASQKADDYATADGCAACHDYIDGRVPAVKSELDAAERKIYLYEAIIETNRRYIDEGLL